MKKLVSGFVLVATVLGGGVAGAQEFTFDSMDWSGGGGSYSDPIGTGYNSYGSYNYDYITGNTLADNSLYIMPNVGSNWDLAGLYPNPGYTIVNNVMWPTCTGCTDGLTGQEATMLGIFDVNRQYNSLWLFFHGYGWTNSMYMGSYQGDTSFFVSNQFAFTHDLAAEVYGQSIFNLNTPWCPTTCVANMTAGTLTNPATGGFLSNRIGQVYDYGAPAYTPPSSGGDGDGDGDGDGG